MILNVARSDLMQPLRGISGDLRRQLWNHRAPECRTTKVVARHHAEPIRMQRFGSTTVHAFVDVLPEVDRRPSRIQGHIDETAVSFMPMPSQERFELKRLQIHTEQMEVDPATLLATLTNNQRANTARLQEQIEPTVIAQQRSTTGRIERRGIGGSGKRSALELRHFDTSTRHQLDAPHFETHSALMTREAPASGVLPRRRAEHDGHNGAEGPARPVLVGRETNVGGRSSRTPATPRA